MDSPLVFIVVIVVVGIALYAILSESQRRHSAWEKLAEQLGLRFEGGILQGEFEGVPVRLAMEMRKLERDFGQVCVVRAEVPGALPVGFVAAPRRWTSGLDRLMSENIFPSTDPALQECYVFQSALPHEGRALIQDAEAQKALLELYSPRRLGFVEHNRTHVVYPALLDDVEEARMALKDVVGAAQTLARVRARQVLEAKQG